MWKVKKILVYAQILAFFHPRVNIFVENHKLCRSRGASINIGVGVGVGIGIGIGWGWGWSWGWS